MIIKQRLEIAAEEAGFFEAFADGGSLW